MRSSKFQLARERAEAAIGKRPEEPYLKERRRIEEQNREKTDRLRALRLAKEAADAEVETQVSQAPRGRKRNKC